MSECIWRGTQQPRAVRNRHTDECTDDYCKGCQPCKERHCLACGINHSLDQLCPSCLNAVRGDLNAVLSMSSTRNLRAEAVHASNEDGNLVAGSPIPGGEAMVLLGPWSDGSARTLARYDAANTKDLENDERRGDRMTTQSMLASWAQDWTESGAKDLHPAFDDDVTWAAKHHPAFDDFAREIRQHRAYLEALLHEGEQHDTGAPCEICGKDLERLWEINAKDDHWWCGRCKKSFDPGEYVEMVSKAARKHKHWLTSRDMEAEHRIPRGTLTSWAAKSDRNPEPIRKRLDIHIGRQVYNVADALARRNAKAESA